MTQLAGVAFTPYEGTGSCQLRTPLCQAGWLRPVQSPNSCRALEAKNCIIPISQRRRLRLRKVKSCGQKLRFVPLPAALKALCQLL